MTGEWKGARWTALLAFGLFGLLVLAGGLTYGSSASSPPQTAKAGAERQAERPPGPSSTYLDLVRREFIDKGRLVVRADVEPNSGVPIVDLTPDVYSGKDAAAWRFATDSFLLQDIRRNDPSLWVIENGRVTDMNPFAHVTPLPFEQELQWRGEVRFRATPSVVGESDIHLVPRGWNGPTLRLMESTGALQTGDRRIAKLVLSAPAQGELRAVAIDVYCGTGDEGPLARIRRVGDEVAIWGERTSDCSAKSAAGTLSQQRFDAVGRGERLVFTAGRTQFAYERTRASRPSGALSSVTAAGSRVREPTTAWWTAGLERDFFRARPNRNSKVFHGDVITSLDPQLQPGVQAVLDRFMAERARSAGEVAAITVMDAQTGEVLAMASSPNAPFHTDSIVDLDDGAARTARQNQNLQLLPIGSVAKPLFAAAILKDQPELLTLKIDGSAGSENLLGMPMPRLNNHAAAGIVDLDRFIQESDNIYAAALLLLGSRDRGTDTCSLAGQRYSLGGEWRDRLRPKSVFEERDSSGRCKLAPPMGTRQIRWADTLHDLFDVNVSTRPGDQQYSFPNCSDGGDRFGDSVHEASVWRALFQERPALRPCGFTESTPVREALAIDAARSFRSELLPVMLGNGEGRWTTIKVAEAYSRLVTGRRVRASLMRNSKPALPLETFAARIPLTHAMTLVPQGTASGTGLPPALDQATARLATANLAFGAFAKTGTPVAVRSDYAPVDKAINLLIQNNKIGYDRQAASISLRLGGRSYDIAPNLPRARQSDIAKVLRADPIQKEATTRFGVSSAAVAQKLVAYAEAIDQGQVPFVVQRGALLVRVGARRDDNGNEADDRVAHGKVIALVVGAYDQGAQSGAGRPAPALDASGRVTNGAMAPLRAYAVVVSLQFETPGRKNAAADLAGEVVSHFLIPRLERAREPGNG